MARTKIIKARTNTIPHLNFGLQMMIRGKIFTMTGISPSPAYKDIDALLNDIIAFVNKKCGTHYKLINAEK